MLQISLLIIVVALSLSPTFGKEFGEHRPEEIKLQHGAVATDDRRCSRIGRAVLKEGGHAVDATVASVLCLGVVSSASSGIGGGAFMLLRLANGKAQAFDSRETAPLRAYEILNILAEYGIPSGVSGSVGLHRLIESLKHMFSVRMNLGDPDFVNVSEVLSDMLSPKFAHELKKTILDNMTFTPDHYGGKWNVLSDHGTSHLCIVDSERNAISMTSTVNSYFGAQILSPSTGILLNNEMDDFSIPMNVTANVPPPAPANFIRPFKRPLSSMSPTIVVKDGQLKAVVGASGGSMIIAGTTEVFLNYFAKGMDPLSSVMSPRLYHQLIPNVVQYENWTTVSGDHFEVPAATRQALQKKGHFLEPLAGGTICQFIVHNIDKSKSIAHERVQFGSLTAVSDPRKGGLPAGY